jgi:hypothetical protein
MVKIAWFQLGQMARRWKVTWGWSRMPEQSSSSRMEAEAAAIVLETATSRKSCVKADSRRSCLTFLPKPRKKSTLAPRALALTLAYWPSG